MDGAKGGERTLSLLSSTCAAPGTILASPFSADFSRVFDDDDEEEDFEVDALDELLLLLLVVVVLDDVDVCVAADGIAVGIDSLESTVFA